MLLISHDRAFLDNVVTDTWAFMGDAVVEEFVGGYQDWLRQTEHRRGKTVNKSTTSIEKVEIAQNKEKATKPKPKLSYNEQRELEALPSKIAALEQEQQLLQHKLNDSNFYVNSPKEVVIVNQRLAVIDEELLTLLERWTQLES